MRGALLVSAPGTGEGKTLAATALCSALRARGMTVQPFKVGPDYIDTRFYERICGRTARNVDLWLDGADGVRANVELARADADALIFEGMMGLFDGDDEGETSSAHVALLLDIPIVLVIDLWRCSQSAAAIAQGCAQYDPRVRIAGVILNRVGGPAHERAVRRAFEQTGIPILAAIPHSPQFTVGERHLGLDPAAIDQRTAAVRAFGKVLADHIDLSAFGFGASVPRPATPARAGGPRIAYANDEAFWFTYAETLQALQECGAELVPFSPLADRELPANLDGLWISGGYPELFAAQLEANTSMRSHIAAALRAGTPAYAECGGMMYLAQTLVTAAGSFAMVGAVQGSTTIAEPRLCIGYRNAEAACATPLDQAGARIRGYEFHYAQGALGDAAPAYRFDDGRVDGTASPSLCAAFMHRRFLPGSAAIARFVATCAAKR